ncbi:hypothetical protein ACOME3_010434, partial [Neoechinorhynchus agilis]
AEGVRALIEATSHLQAQTALRCLSGSVRDAVSHWRKDLLEIISELDAIIDFGEDHSSDGALTISSELRNTIVAVREEMLRFVNQSKRSRMRKYGHKVVIVGAPNVGKSSLLNILVNEEIAIVSNLPGTTRDFIQVNVDLIGPSSINLIDTAGLNDDIFLEFLIAAAEGRLRSIQKAREADLILWVIDANNAEEVGRDPRGNLRKMLRGYLPEDDRIFIAFNKIDLCRSFEAADFTGNAIFPTSRISCFTRENISDFKAKLSEFMSSRFSPNHFTSAESIFIDDRQLNCVRKAADEIENAISLIDNSEDQLCQVVALRRAINELANISPELNIETDDVLNQIFEKFCIGK